MRTPRLPPERMPAVYLTSSGFSPTPYLLLVYSSCTAASVVAAEMLWLHSAIRQAAQSAVAVNRLIPFCRVTLFIAVFPLFLS